MRFKSGNSLLDVLCGSPEIFGTAEVAPVEIVCAKGRDFFTGLGEAEIGVDDGEDAGFGDEV